MPIRKDCVDFGMSVNVQIGVRYDATQAAGVDDSTRNERAKIIMELRPGIEQRVMAEICSALGYSREVVDQKTAEREAQVQADRAAEDAGRAEKNALRAGLPTPPPAPKAES